MDESAVVLLITSIIAVLIMGVMLAVTVSLALTAKKINKRLDDLDENLNELVLVMNNLSQSSQSELNELHTTLAQQQRVHQSIRATSRLVDIVFRRPVVNTAAAGHAVSGFNKRRKLRKKKKVEENV